MYSIDTKNKIASRIERTNFSDLEMQEKNIEEILENSIEMLCDEEDSMLIVGRQVRNKERGRSDLTAIDHNGNIVLIEIKRDKKDIVCHNEAFEFQAIRYAASYATINDVESLVDKIYAPYIKKNKKEFELGGLTPYELGLRKVKEFLEGNEAIDKFNQKQRIILVASDFDEQTLSAVAWLNSNNVDISCYKLIPYKLDEKLFFKIEKILPIPDYDEFYVDLVGPSVSKKRKIRGTRRSLPKIDKMLEWGVVKAGDLIIPKDRKGEALLLKNGNVLIDDEEKTMQAWLKDVYGWSSVQTYKFAFHKETGRSLSQIRKEYMEKEGMDV